MLLSEEKAGDGNRQFSHELSACIEWNPVAQSVRQHAITDRNNGNSHSAERDLF